MIDYDHNLHMNFDKYFLNVNVLHFESLFMYAFVRNFASQQKLIY